MAGLAAVPRMAGRTGAGRRGVGQSEMGLGRSEMAPMAASSTACRRADGVRRHAHLAQDDPSGPASGEAGRRCPKGPDART